MIRRLWCILRSHPRAYDVVEEGAMAEDLIAGTGSIEFSAWCPTCNRTVWWTESNV